MKHAQVIEITNNHVITKCPECGREMKTIRNHVEEGKYAKYCECGCQYDYEVSMEEIYKGVNT